MRQLLRCPSAFAGGVITVRGVSGTRRPTARRLRDNSPLHVNATGDALSNVRGLPSMLQNGVYYVPSIQEDAACDEDQHLILSATSSVQVYVLWPALQDPPHWLRDNFQQLRGIELKMLWSFNLKQRAILNFSNCRKAFEQQTLQVWQLRAGVQDDTTISLPGTGLDVSSSTPVYPYVFCVKPGAAAMVTAALTGRMIMPSMRQANPLTCNIHQLRSMLEDDLLQGADFSSSTVSALVRRCLKEQDPELLLLLLEQDLGGQADEDVLQELLNFAVANHEVQLVQATLGAGPVELTKQELDWWVRELAAGPNLFDAERLLADYCLCRRNHLNAVAAVEAALVALKAGAHNSNGAGHLARKFGAVKHTLLHQLQERHTQQLAAAALLDTTPAGPDTEGMVPLHPSGLQQAIINCMEVKTACKDSSIHDVSPFRKAVVINDTQLLNQGPIKMFSRELWVGLELLQLYDEVRATVRPPTRSSTRRSRTSIDGGAFNPLIQQKIWQGSHDQPRSDSAAGRGSAAGGASDSGKGSQQVPGSSRAGLGPPLHDPAVGCELLQNLGMAGEGMSSRPVQWACRLLHLVVLAPRAFFNSPRGQWAMHCSLELVFLVTYQCLVLNVSWSSLAMLFSLLVAGNLVQAVNHIFILHGGSIRRYLSSNTAKLDLLVHMGLAVVAGTWMAEGPLKAHWTWDLAAALAVPVWARALGVVVPANARLGALLYTLGRMVEEAYSMGIIIVVLLLGFSTTLYALYHNLMSDYSTFLGAFRMFVGVMASDLHLQDFEQAAGDDSYRAWFGQSMTMLFVVVVNILLMTLLIAVINHTYHPEGVAKQTTVMFAGAVDAYMLQVQEGLAWAPMNIPQLLLSWFPRRYRRRVPHQYCLDRWLPPVDGYSSSAGPSRSTSLILTGPSELAYVLFVVTLYLFIGVAAVGLLVLYIPVGVVYFAAQGHKQWLGREWSEPRSQRNRRQRGAMRGTRDSRGSFDIPRPPLPAAADTNTGTEQLLPVSPPRCNSERVPAQPALGWWEWEPLQVVGWGLQVFLVRSGAVVVALVAQLVLVLVMLAVLLYSLMGQLVWALWCSFCWWLLPQGMVTQQEPPGRRYADYWSAGDMLVAYAANNVLSSRAAGRRSGSVPGAGPTRMNTEGGWKIGTEVAGSWSHQPLQQQHSAEPWAASPAPESSLSRMLTGASITAQSTPGAHSAESAAAGLSPTPEGDSAQPPSATATQLLPIGIATVLAANNNSSSCSSSAASSRRAEGGKAGRKTSWSVEAVPPVADSHHTAGANSSPLATPVAAGPSSAAALEPVVPPSPCSTGDSASEPEPTVPAVDQGKPWSTASVNFSQPAPAAANNSSLYPPTAMPNSRRPTPPSSGKQSTPATAFGRQPRSRASLQQ